VLDLSTPMPIASTSQPRPALRLLLWGAVAVTLLTGACAVNRLRVAARLADASEAFEREIAAPDVRLLVVGDSTGVGTGATSPNASLAGLIAARFPSWSITNRARDGATFADVLVALEGVATDYDIVLIQAGGNDVIRMRNLDDVAAEVDRVVRRACELADVVVLMPAGNVGNAPFFAPPLSWLMTSRSRRLHAAVAQAARRHDAVYVDLYKERDADPFVLEPGLNAADGLHPSDAGYRVWFGQLLDQAKLGTAARVVAAGDGASSAACRPSI
jgi:lysophospholipase L1-like esterase